jgi:putative tricarboxylic transport membrane protein
MRNPRDVATGAFTLVIAAAVFVLARDFPGGTRAEGMGANFLPILLASILATLSVLLIGKGYLFAPSAAEAEADVSPRGVYRAFRPALMCLFVLLYLLVLEYAGYVIATPVFLFAVVSALGGGRGRAAIAALALTAGIWLVFGVLLKVPLPDGTLLWN